MSLVIFTAFVGIVAAPGTLHPLLALVALLAIAVGAGASGALNMWYDADIDAMMKRTRSRPVPRGAILPGEALGFGASLAVGSVIALGLLVNLVAACPAGLHHFLLCRHLHHVAEALDAAEHRHRRCRRRISADDRLGRGDGHDRSRLAFRFSSSSSCGRRRISGRWRCSARMIMRRAGVPMLPNVAGPDETRKQILLYTLVLLPLTFLPALLGVSGLLYVMGVALLSAMLSLLRHQCLSSSAKVLRPTRACKKLFGFSILWLFLVFALIPLERICWALPRLRIGAAVNNAPFSPEDMARRRKRSIVLALMLAGLVVLFFATTIVRLGGNFAAMSGGLT